MELKHKVTATFCDNTKTEQEFLDTAWGNLQAKEHFHTLVDQGKENGTIWECKPHLLMVVVNLIGHDEACERFTCSCASAVIANA